MPQQLLAAYPQASPRYDEMLDRTGAVREHWRGLWDVLVASRADEMRRRLDYVNRQVHENGITYNVYADPQGADRPWELDLLPLIVPAEEWAQIESAIMQRAELLNRILADVYGDQTLIREGRLPPALIYGQEGFLRACRGIRPPGGVHLHVYAADLARSPDGRWWVIADRTQSPSGAGYALENRLVISRVFPELFRDLKVQHLASFFSTLRDSLAQWAPRDDAKSAAPPLIVLLTPGPYNETYFEHAYLARYLGFPLVEGSDLTVRDGCVWLKTLSGLQRVHAILRRLDDDFSDPLELRSDSALGIPGLTQAARLGNVLIANALGANVLESGVLLGYLPGTVRAPAGRAAGVAVGGDLVVRRAGGARRRTAQARWPGGQAGFSAIALRARVRPGLGTAPARKADRANACSPSQLRGAGAGAAVSGAGMESRAIRGGSTRASSACACSPVPAPTATSSCRAGLTRVGSDADARVLSMQRGGSSKDTWVLAAGPVNTLSLLRRAIGPQDIVRSGANLSSRVVEDLFWFGRYTERCDGTARLLRIALDRLLEDADTAQPAEWQAIVGLCRLLGVLPAADAEETPVLPIDEGLIQAIVDHDDAATLAANLRQLFRVAFHLRERLSIDNWRTINHLVQDLSRRKEAGMSLNDAFDFLDRTVLSLMTLAGFAMDGMTRDQGWRFLSMGRRIERLQFMCQALRHCLDAAGDDFEWLLELGDSIVTYRSRYMARPERLPAFDLLMLDVSNPRALIFQVAGVSDYLQRQAEQLGPCGEDLMPPLLRSLEALDLARALGSADGLQKLAGLLDDIIAGTSMLSEQLAQRYFTHVDANRQTVSM